MILACFLVDIPRAPVHYHVSTHVIAQLHANAHVRKGNCARVTLTASESGMDCPPSPKRGKQLRPDQRVCPHCNQVVSYKTFRTHRRFYFNSETKQWLLDSRDQSEASTSGVGDEVLSESPPEEEVYHCDGMELSPPLPDRPSSYREESPPLSEPGAMSSSGSTLNSDSKLLK